MAGIKESELSKGDLRKLNALRKSLGNRIAEKAFAEWYADKPAAGNQEDPIATRIEEALAPSQ